METIDPDSVIEFRNVRRRASNNPTQCTSTFRINRSTYTFVTSPTIMTYSNTYNNGRVRNPYLPRGTSARRSAQPNVVGPPASLVADVQRDAEGRPLASRFTAATPVATPTATRTFFGVNGFTGNSTRATVVRASVRTETNDAEDNNNKTPPPTPPRQAHRVLNYRPPVLLDDVNQQGEEVSTMGGQSQFRNKLQKRQRKDHAYNERCVKRSKQRDKKRGQVQGNLAGERAFDPIVDCIICKHRHWAKTSGNTDVSEPKRAHDPDCPKSKVYKSRATEQTKKYNTSKEKPVPPTQAEARDIMRNFFKQRIQEKRALQKKLRTSGRQPPQLLSKPDNFAKKLSEDVEKYVHDEEFRKKYTSTRKSAPIAVMAVARFIVDELLPRKSSVASEDKFEQLYAAIPKETLSFEIPSCRKYDVLDKPHYHSVQGQTILHVRWEVQFPDLDLVCPCTSCDGSLMPDRTNFLKNKKLFPIFGFDGPPRWCIVMSYDCSVCKARFTGNDGRLLASLPPHVRAAYPVEPRYASASKICHVHKDVTLLYDELLTTYSNGEHVSRCLYRVINEDYKNRALRYFSLWSDAKKEKPHVFQHKVPPEYPVKDGEFLTFYPPVGADIREAFYEASVSDLTLCGISDYIRHTREIQSVTTTTIIVQDHTNEVVKNYNRSATGAHAVWDVMTETGEIACAVLVDGTSVQRIAHAAEKLSRRPGFAPKGFYSDTWPHKTEFWKLIFGPHLEGRLGLFHFMQRIIRTLRQGHYQYHEALADLSMAVYQYHPVDYERLLGALRAGTIGGKKRTSEEISKLQKTAEFKRKFQQHLRKIILPGNTIRLKLTQWFDKYKVVSSDPINSPAGGSPDPNTGKYLFTSATKPVVEEQKKKCDHLGDPAPIDSMYREVKPPINSKHGLSKWLSLRGESKLESFHNPLANFGNGNMNRHLADALNLLGTCRHNVKVRHRLWLADTALCERPKMYQQWEDLPSYFNHSDLLYINGLARLLGCKRVPFLHTRSLPPDNGERYYSDYLIEQEVRDKLPSHPTNDLCPCRECVTNLESPTKLSNVGWYHPPECSNVQIEDEISVHSVASPQRIPDQTQVAADVLLPTETTTPTLGSARVYADVPLPTATATSTPTVHRQEQTGPTLAQRCQPLLSNFLPQPQIYTLRPDAYPWFAFHQTWPVPTVRPSAQHQICCHDFYVWTTQTTSNGRRRRGRPKHSTTCHVRSGL